MSENTEYSNFAGEYELDYFELLLAEGEGIDITEQIDVINIYEDMYTPFITGKVVMRDTIDIPNYLGRGGKDLINLSIRTKGIDKTKPRNVISGLFWVYKMGDRAMVGDRMQQYAFYFASVEMLFDFKRQISSAFKGTSDEIIGQILKKYYPDSGKEFFTDKSSHQMKFISNFWQPQKCIEYCTQHAISPSGDASFSFFENRDGFNFKTLSTIFNIDKEKPYQVFKDNDFSADIVTEGDLMGTAERNPNKDVQVVQAIRVDTLYDYLDVYNSGAISTRLTSYDLLKKTVSAKTVQARPDSRINKSPLFPEQIVKSVDPLRVFTPKHYDVTDYANSTNSKFFQSRMQDMRVINSQKIEIDVFGRTDYTVGKVIYYDSSAKVQITAQDDPNNLIDVVYSGYYVITAINHRFTKKAHLCTIELSREGSIA